MSARISKAVVQAGGTIAVGGTAVQALAANMGRETLFIQNNSTTATLWFRVDGSAATTASPSIAIPAGGSATFDTGVIPTGPLSLNSSETGLSWSVLEG